MAEHIEKLDRKYRDNKGIVVNVIGYDREGQRVIYMRDGYEFECAAPLIIFRARFKRVEE
ncbi:DUF4222 domain-containing protein [Ewingella americana]|jgi:hypothetical protein|uniref:DUF4222 domain-containing protein n=1 Tax=Ewingella americana TaxID=41202 RepID=UPI00163AFD40|nr:DUF4222 domain-containing protein [Ewingella americana]QMV54102.1 DUF4222 domain-containing protein [Ewingella americana]